MKPGDCSTCWGCGRLANTEKREPWVAWMQLPMNSALAVMLGLVRPVPCDACGGTGKDREAARAQDTENHLNPDEVTCPLCHDRGWQHMTLTRGGSMPGPSTENVAAMCSCFKADDDEAQRRHQLVCGCPRPWVRWADLAARGG